MIGAGRSDDESWWTGRVAAYSGRWETASGAGSGGLGRFRAVWAGLDRSGWSWTGLGRLGRSGPLWTGSTGLDRPGGPGGLDRSDSGRSGPGWGPDPAWCAWSGVTGSVWGGLDWPGWVSPGGPV